MIQKLIEGSIRNRALVILLAVVLAGLGYYCLKTLPLDAIPDLSDVQVIVFAEYPGQSPQVVEDQVTYPLSTAMLGVPNTEAVRGMSFFGFSFVYVIFEDGTDIYWARSRVLEQLSAVASNLPKGASARLGPDATGVGWVYEYALVTGPYCKDYPRGIYLDEENGAWYSSIDQAPAEVRESLVLYRIFPDMEKCPLGDGELAEPDLDLSDLRAVQDWYLKFELSAVEGVAEIASIGGFVKQYQVTVSPTALMAKGIPLSLVRKVLAESNREVGARVIESGESEFMVRLSGYLGTTDPRKVIKQMRQGLSLDEIRTKKVVEDLKQIPLKADESGAVIRLGDVAQIKPGPEIRRGLADLDGKGEVVGGIVVARFGENARDVIKNVTKRLQELKPGLPPGISIIPTYDRSDLIHRAVATLQYTLLEEMLSVTLVILLFLLHIRSSMVAVFVLPLGVLTSFVFMRMFGITANIMSIGGIAIAIGVMVDSSIIMVENAHKHLEEVTDKKLSAAKRMRVIKDAAVEVGPSLFFSLLILTVSFLPVFTLGQESGRLFKPLAFTKTFAMAAAAFLAVTVIPVLMYFFIRGRMISEKRNPISKLLQRVYDPVFRLTVRHRYATVILAAIAIAVTVIPFSKLGSEFMPPLEEGDLLYMPTTDPAISITEARSLLQQTDKLIATFPEVERVFGKVGRAETSTDPAPLSMIETTIILKRDKSAWRKAKVERFYDSFPEWLKAPFRLVLPDTRPITVEELKYGFIDENGQPQPGLDDVVRFPGLTNAWTMPIRTRIDMLSTGIKTPIGIKFMGDDLELLAKLAKKTAALLRADKELGKYTASAYPEKSTGGKYLDIKLDRDELARLGLTIEQGQKAIAAGLGGINLTNTVEGLARYPVQLRYERGVRESLEAIRGMLVSLPDGRYVPLRQLAQVSISSGPPVIKTENARKTAWVYVDIKDIDVGTYVKKARQLVQTSIPLPPGYSIVWSGQYEYMRETEEKLLVVVPAALVLIIILLYAATQSWFRVVVVLLAVPFSLVGAIWLLYLLGYNTSLAVWVGMIALAGLDAETGLVMLLYLENSYKSRLRKLAKSKLSTKELYDAIHDGAVKRIRPKTMTVVTTFAGLLPLMWAQGAGADTMRRLAAPMIGGLFTSFIMELLVYPAIYYIYRTVKKS